MLHVSITIDFGTSTHAHRKSLKHEQRIPTLKERMRERLGIVVYLPSSANFLYHFRYFLYASWEYVTKHSANYTEHNILIDILIFTDNKTRKELPTKCKLILPKDLKKLVKEKSHSCWVIEQNSEVDFEYSVLNSFIMFTRSDVNEISNPYDYFLRTDLDTFITPAILDWKTVHTIAIGNGQYCEPFNQERLKQISRNLRLNHRGVHCVGSTWYGNAQELTFIAQRTFQMTKYIYRNEFKPELPGLESIDFKNNPDGKWKRWYRGVSLLYASEIILNDAISDFDETYFAPLDVNACAMDNIYDHVHVHCYHDKCKFNKFQFVDVAHKMIYGDTFTSKAFLRHFLSTRNVRDMSVTDYCFYIAYNSLARYVYNRDKEK